MTKLLTAMAVLAVLATPALAQPNVKRGAVVKHRAQIERSVPTFWQPEYVGPTVGDR